MVCRSVNVQEVVANPDKFDFFNDFDDTYDFLNWDRKEEAEILKQEYDKWWQRKKVKKGMLDCNGQEIKIGDTAIVAAYDSGAGQTYLVTGLVSNVWGDNYCEVACEGETSEECGVAMPFTVGAISEAIMICERK